MWKPSTEITASATMSGSRYAVTDPNVLTLLDQNATITVDSGSSQDEACVALGPSKDVAGWVASEKSYTRITGLASWSELSTQKGSSTSQGAPTVPMTRCRSRIPICGRREMRHWVCSLKSKKTGASTVAIVDLGENVTTPRCSCTGCAPKCRTLRCRSICPADCWPCWPYCAPPCSPCRRISAASAWVEGMASAVIEEEAPASIAVVREAGWCRST